MVYDFGCDVGDILYVADLDLKYVRTFEVDILKVAGDKSLSAHGWISYKTWSSPTEFSLKHLNKRIIFTHKKLAQKWLDSQLSKNTRRK